MSLWSQFYENPGKDVFKWVHYLPIYEKHFQRYVNQTVTVLEIGCLHGGSLQMWKRYLGPHARIVGIDINPACAAHEEDQIHVRIGSQDDKAFLRKVAEEFGPFDIVIDDGSHICEHLITSFEVLYGFVKDNGIYVAEDLHTNYWNGYGGGVRRTGTFIEHAKLLIDELNAYHTQGALDVTRFTNTTASIHFYDSMIFFEKAVLSARRDLIVGTRDGQRVRQTKQLMPLKKT
jgi:23S rRNA U2552 (ribose-2'-O)-methylase RlmE/FtsJ